MPKAQRKMVSLFYTPDDLVVIKPRGQFRENKDGTTDVWMTEEMAGDILPLVGMLEEELVLIEKELVDLKLQEWRIRVQRERWAVK
jgi:hypothetical protein